MSIRLRLLGAPAIQHEGEWFEPPPGRISALLYYLAYRGGWVGRNDLAFLFWPDSPEENARSNLRKTLARARQLAYSRGLEADRTRLRWGIETDLASFREAAAGSQWLSAIRHYGGELLAGFVVHDAPEFERWLEQAREDMRRAYREAVLGQAGELEAARRFSEAAELLDSLRSFDPFDEDVLRRQLHDFHVAGQRHQALAVFERFRAYLDDEFAAEPEGSTLTLVERIRSDEGTGGGAVVAPLSVAVAPRPPHNLPAEVSPFVGRQLERERIAALLADPACRLLTLVGPGGMGKTRLALAAGSAQLGNFSDGVWFVPLAATSTPEQMVNGLGQALGLTAAPRGGREQIVSHLGDRECLLILDNLEQLTEGAGLIGDLLEAAPGLKVLATSREQLHLRAEWLFEVPGLGYPAEDSLDDVEIYDAVELFRRHAERIQPGFGAKHEQLQQVAQICRLVAGMPLALELAASWLRVLTSADIVAELEQSVDLLETSAPDMPERHRSIRAVFDYSWRLLTASQQRTMAALAIFRGGFERMAAQRITKVSTRDLLELVGKSLLQRRETGRFDMHPLTFQYVKAKLAELPKLHAEMQENHGAHYLQHLRGLDEALREGRQKDALEAMDADAANIDAMWQWAVAERKLAELDAMAGGLDKFFTQRNRYREGIDLFEKTVQGLDSSDPTHHRVIGRILGGLAWFHTRLGEYSQGMAHGERALRLLQPLEPSSALTEAFNVLGAISGITGRYVEAKSYFEQALALARTMEDGRYLAYYLNNSAITEKELGNYPEAETLYRESLELSRSVGEQVSTVRNLNNLGLLLRAMGRFEEAEIVLQDGLEMATNLGFEQTLPHVLGSLGGVAFDRGDYAEAQGLFQEALRLARETRTRGNEANLLGALGMVSTALGEYRDAQDLFREGLTLAVELESNKLCLGILTEVIELRARQDRFAEAADLLATILEHPAADSATRNRARSMVEQYRDLSPGPAAEAAEPPALESLLPRVLAGLSSVG